MKKCQFENDIFNELDLFGKIPELYYKGKPQKTTYVGLILSILYVAIYIVFFIYKLIRMINKLDIDFYETYSFIGTPSITLNNQNFYAGFSIGGIVDKQIYYPVFQYWIESRTNGIKNDPIVKNLDLEVCQLEKFGKNHQDLFKDKPLQNFYCLKEIKEDLIGYGSLDTFSYYYIMLFPCVGTHPDGTPCKPIEEVTNFFQKTFLEFTVQDIELTPKDYDNPSYPLTKDITTPVFQGLYQSIFGYFQIVNLETNLDVLGFEATSSNKHEKLIKYDESWIIASPSPHVGGLNPYYPVSDVTIQLAAKVLTIKRDNTKLIDVLGDVGGLMEFLFSFFNIISMFITDLLYDIDLVNNLFSFDLDKKQVLIKNLKNQENKNNNISEDEDKKNIYNIKNRINPINSRNNDNKELDNLKYTITKDENSINQDITIRKKQKRISKKMVTSNGYRRTYNIKDDKISNSEMNKEILDLNKNKNKRNPAKINEINNGTIFSSNQIITNEDRNRTIEEKRNIIKEVYINKFFVIFAFCCIKKRKNVNIYILEEGIELIKEKLDILNIFKKLFYEEQLLNDFKNTKNEIKMSDKCKQKIE